MHIDDFRFTLSLFQFCYFVAFCQRHICEYMDMDMDMESNGHVIDDVTLP